MKPLHYVVSENGTRIAVGVIGDKQEALELATLAENIYGINHSDDLYDRIMYFSSFDSFKKFLILKEYFALWDEHWTRNKFGGRLQSDIMKFTRRAIKRAKITIDSCVSYENFMYLLSSHNNEYQIGSYSDENFAE